MQHINIFSTSYVLIGNLRLACCDCSIGHEIAKKDCRKSANNDYIGVCVHIEKFTKFKFFLRTFLLVSLLYGVGKTTHVRAINTRWWRVNWLSAVVFFLRNTSTVLTGCTHKSVCMYARLNSLSMLHDWPDWPWFQLDSSAPWAHHQSNETRFSPFFYHFFFSFFIGWKIEITHSLRSASIRDIRTCVGRRRASTSDGTKWRCKKKSSFFW